MKENSALSTPNRVKSYPIIIRVYPDQINVDGVIMSLHC